MEELLDKCQHLLRPIRDLEQNWSVDLANELTRAVISLNEQMVSFGQNGDQIIDFSKAAMIIQGSAHVYSKKVDYLYKAVFEMKEWMEKLWEVEKKSRNRSKAADGASLDVDVEEDDELELSCINEDETIFKESDSLDQIDGSVLLPPKPTNLSGTFNIKIPLKSISGDVIGYMDDFLLNSIDVEAIVNSQSPSCESSEVNKSDFQPNVAELPDAMEGDLSNSYNEGPEPLDIIDNTLVAEPELPPVDAGDQTETPNRIDKQARVLRPRAMQPPPTPKEPPVDPWTQILDPYSVELDRPSKALKPGNCRVLPPSLRKGRKRRPNGDQAADRRPDDIVTFCNKEYSSAFSAAGSNLLFPEFKILFADNLKKRQEALKALKKRSRYVTEEEYIVDEYAMGGIDEEDGGDWDGQGLDNNDEPCGNIPFSRLQGEVSMVPDTSVNRTNDLPVGYSDLLAQVLRKQYENIADSDKLTEIDKRVKAWESNVRGAIETSETRPAFDMLHYSDSIFSSFVGDQSTVFMDQLLEGKQKYDAFRTFVSALILANHGNLEIVEDHQQVQLKLLHKTTLSDVIASDVTAGSKEVNMKPTVFT